MGKTVHCLQRVQKICVVPSHNFTFTTVPTILAVRITPLPPQQLSNNVSADEDATVVGRRSLVIVVGNPNPTLLPAVVVGNPTLFSERRSRLCSRSRCVLWFLTLPPSNFH